MKEIFIGAKKHVCVCGESICKDVGLKECSVYEDVMKSQCVKAQCMVENIWPKISKVLQEMLHESDAEDDYGNDDGNSDYEFECVTSED